MHDGVGESIGQDTLGVIPGDLDKACWIGEKRTLGFQARNPVESVRPFKLIRRDSVPPRAELHPLFELFQYCLENLMALQAALRVCGFVCLQWLSPSTRS